MTYLSERPTGRFGKPINSVKRLRKPKFDALEEALGMWLANMLAKKAINLDTTRALFPQVINIGQEILRKNKPLYLIILYDGTWQCMLYPLTLHFSY